MDDTVTITFDELKVDQNMWSATPGRLERPTLYVSVEDPDALVAALLGAGAVPALAVLYPALRQVGSYPATDQPFQELGPKTAAIYALLGDFLAPPDGPLPGSGGDATSLARLDQLLASVPDHTALLLQALPLAFEHATALDRYGARRLSHLPPDRQRAFLTEWADADDLVRAQHPPRVGRRAPHRVPAHRQPPRLRPA